MPLIVLITKFDGNMVSPEQIKPYLRSCNKQSTPHNICRDMGLDEHIYCQGST